MKRMILNLLWLAAIITPLELLTAHRSSPKDYHTWTKEYLEQSRGEIVLQEELHVRNMDKKEEELICNFCE